MSGELRMVRGALVWGAVAAAPAAGIAWAARGPEGAVSVMIALGIVLANTAAAAALSSIAARLSTMASAMISLPSFAIRTAAIFGALAALKGASFIDDPTFAISFALAVTAVLVLEARAWKRTPWLALTLAGTPGSLGEEKS